MQTDYSPPPTKVDDQTAARLTAAIAAARSAGHEALAAQLTALAVEHGLVLENAHKKQAAKQARTWPLLLGAQALLLCGGSYLYRTGGFSWAQFQALVLVLLLGGGLLLVSNLQLRPARKECWSVLPYLVVGLVALLGKTMGMWSQPALLITLVVLQTGLVGYLWRTRFLAHVHSLPVRPHRAARKQPAE